MTKLNKVIKAFEKHISNEDDCCNDCPYDPDNEHSCLEIAIEDALELLKEKNKLRESRKMLPCKCGCKRREHWFGASYDNPEGLKCMKCGFEVWGKNATDVIQKWNEAVKPNDKT